MKEAPDINDTLRNEGEDAARKRHDRAQKFNGAAPGQRPVEEQGLEGVSLNDFHAYMPQHSYIFAPTREMWVASSVNARVHPIPVLNARASLFLTKKASRR